MVLGANRTIIIPKGTLNSDDVNVVLVPRCLQNSNLPLLVTPATRSRLRATSLPAWGDELDPNSGLPVSGDEEDEDDEEISDVSEGADGAVEYVKATICTTSPITSPRILHMSTRTITKTNDGPLESMEMTIDAPEGVDQKELETVMKKTGTDSGSGVTMHDRGSGSPFQGAPTVAKSTSMGKCGASCAASRAAQAMAQSAGGACPPVCRPVPTSGCTPI